MHPIQKLALLTLIALVLLVPAHSFAKDGAENTAVHGIQAQIQALLERIHMLQSHAGGRTATTTGSRDAEKRPASGDMMREEGGTGTSSIKALVIEQAQTSAFVSTSTADVSHSYGIFTVRFDTTAMKQDVYISAVGSSTATSTNGAVTFDITGKPVYEHLSSSVTTTADKVGSYYIIHSGDTETFTLTSYIDPAASGRYAVGLRGLTYRVGSSTEMRTQRVAGKGNEFWTPRVYIPNSNSKGAAALSAVQDQFESFMSSIRQLFSH